MNEELSWFGVLLRVAEKRPFLILSMIVNGFIVTMEMWLIGRNIFGMLVSILFGLSIGMFIVEIIYTKYGVIKCV